MNDRINLNSRVAALLFVLVGSAASGRAESAPVTSKVSAAAMNVGLISNGADLKTDEIRSPASAPQGSLGGRLPGGSIGRSTSFTCTDKDGYEHTSPPDSGCSISCPSAMVPILEHVSCDENGYGNDSVCACKPVPGAVAAPGDRLPEGSIGASGEYVCTDKDNYDRTMAADSGCSVTCPSNMAPVLKHVACDNGAGIPSSCSCEVPASAPAPKPK